MLHNQGRMRLIMGCQFSPEDLQAIRRGYELREALTRSLDTHAVILVGKGESGLG